MSEQPLTGIPYDVEPGAAAGNNMLVRRGMSGLFFLLGAASLFINRCPACLTFPVGLGLCVAGWLVRPASAQQNRRDRIVGLSVPLALLGSLVVALIFGRLTGR